MKRSLFRLKKRMIDYACLMTMATLLIISCTQKSNSSSEKAIWHSEATSRIRVLPAGQGTEIENRIFLLADHIVISQTTNWRVGPWEGTGPALKATAYRVMPDGEQMELWSVNEVADEGRIDEGFFHTIWYGCCAAIPLHSLYHLQSGKLIMEYCDKLLRLEIAHSEMKRFIGYTPGETYHRNSWEKDIKHIGTLTYSSPTGILQKVALRGIGEDYMNKFGLGFADLAFEPSGKEQVIVGPSIRENLGGLKLRLLGPSDSSDTKVFTDIRVRLQFYSGASIEIEIKDDGFFLGPIERREFEIIRVGLN